MKIRHAMGRCLLFGMGGIAVLLVGCLAGVLVICFRHGFGIHSYQMLPHFGSVLHGLLMAVGLLLAMGALGCVALGCCGLAVANSTEHGACERSQ